MHTLAGENWIDFCNRVHLVRKLPLSFKLFGYRYIIFINEMPLCYFAFYPDYEKSETELLCRLKPKVFIDVGSHIDYYSMLVHKLGAEIIIAIEPDPRVFKILNRTVKANKLKNIITINKAAYDKSNFALKLHLSIKPGRSSIFPSNLTRIHEGSITIECITIDEVCSTLNLNKIDFIKIDVEGAELHVLRGAHTTIRQFRPLLLVEVLDANRKNVFEFFTTEKYRPLGPFSHGQNFLFLPEEQFVKLSDIVINKPLIDS
jgi:FkbM family methyltransferase